MTFINLITEILILRESEEGGRAETPHSGGIFFSFLAWMVFVKAIIDAGRTLRLVGGDTPVWSVKKGHLAVAEACRPTADFH